MANEVALVRLRSDVDSLKVLRTTDKLEWMDAIERLNQRLDSIEGTLQRLEEKQTETQALAESNTEATSNLRGYTDRKNDQTRYWVTRAWVYATGGRGGYPRWN